MFAWLQSASSLAHPMQSGRSDPALTLMQVHEVCGGPHVTLCGMQVFQAKLDLADDVAIKFLNPSSVRGNKLHQEKFESEVRIMLLCQHTNVIACMGAFITEVRL